jgi:DNA-binding CsgD family transcriptional regulator
MALLLDISVETVKVHRRHIYKKLLISSQAELFSLAMSRSSSNERR